MVSTIPTQPENTPQSVAHDRGLFTDEPSVVGAYRYDRNVVYVGSFWRPVVAGTLFALSVFVLSWYLMLGFHVGIDSAGMLALGGGAAVWIGVTSCVAFFCGGMMSTTLSATHGLEVVKGLAIWALSIPLGRVIDGLAASGGGPLGNADMARAAIANNAIGAAGTVGTGPHLGYFWAVFITLGLGLIFSVIGSVAGCTCRKSDRTALGTGPVAAETH